MYHSNIIFLNPSIRRNKIAFLAIFMLRLCFICNETFAQTSKTNTPQSASVQPNVTIGFPNLIPNHGSTNSNPNNQLNHYEKDKRQIQKQNADIKRDSLQRTG